MDHKERRFSIDSGNGKKMDGCPYSIYEDGNDVKDYIIPPKGFVFKGFVFDPESCNQIYDGKLIAQYEKESFNDTLKSNLWKLIRALVIFAVIALIVLLAVNVFKGPKSDKHIKPQTSNPITIDTTDASDTATILTTNIINTNQSDSTSVSLTENDNLTHELKDVNASLDDDELMSSTISVDTPNTLFNQEFWALIHQCILMMDSYHNLYTQYKEKVNGEEFDYLKYTILKNSTTFKEWSGKLRKIPANELQEITTINDLKNKLKEM